MKHPRLPSFVVMLAFLTTWHAAAAESQSESRSPLENFIRDIDPRVLTAPDADPLHTPEELRRTLSNDIRERRREVNERDVAFWRSLRTLDQWQKVRDERIEALRASLGEYPEPPKNLNVRVTRTINGDGFQIECLIFESRPGMLVTANLYRPTKRRDSMPGILICTSHHNPKTQGELQDMGMTWARAGCLVLVMDQLGHGERRQHPFRSAKDYDGEFRVGRQDYYFRYNVGIHLHLIGDSLIGWMAWDLMRGVDLLLQQPAVDSKKIILLGAVAGGGDPCAVTAAIDQRIAAAVPFNFGGPQPESVFPLPKDAELSFNYVGGGSWESTRNLRASARGGFLPWIIVGSIAPRRLIYAHEFSWDRDKDPVWRRFQKLYEMHDATDNLSSANGYGRVTLSSNEASHCNNIGAFHRKQIHPTFERWFGIKVEEGEYRNRIDSEELLCIDGVKAATGIEMTKVHRLANRIAEQRIQKRRKSIASLNDPERRVKLKNDWTRLLGLTTARSEGGLQIHVQQQQPIRVTKTVRGTGRFNCPVILLAPEQIAKAGCPIVVAVAQSGKAAFLKHRSAQIAALLDNGIAVCLPDLPGSGELRPGDYRGRRSYATGLSSSELMLGGTILGSRLDDLLSIVRWLRTLDEFDGDRVAIWGDSFASINKAEVRVDVPLRIDDEPDHSEPLGPTLALLAGLFDDRLKAVAARGGLVSIRSILDSPFVYVPHDFAVPGALTAGDLSDVAATLAPRAVWIDGLVDGTNRRAQAATVEAEWKTATAAYSKAADKLRISAQPMDGLAQWLASAVTSD